MDNLWLSDGNRVKFLVPCSFSFSTWPRWRFLSCHMHKASTALPDNEGNLGLPGASLPETKNSPQNERNIDPDTVTQKKEEGPKQPVPEATWDVDSPVRRKQHLRLCLPRQMQRPAFRVKKGSIHWPFQHEEMTHRSQRKTLAWGLTSLAWRKGQLGHWSYQTWRHRWQTWPQEPSFQMFLCGEVLEWCRSGKGQMWALFLVRFFAGLWTRPLWSQSETQWSDQLSLFALTAVTTNIWR